MDVKQTLLELGYSNIKDSGDYYRTKPIYRDSDINVVNSNITLPYYKYPYLHDVLNISDKIEVVTLTTTWYRDST